MALDLVDGKDLLDIIQSGSPALAPHQIRKMTLELLDAIGHVHGQDLLHRDISPDNILLDAAGRPVLIDFGAAREEASRKSRVLSTVLVVKDGYSPQEFYVAGSQQTPSADLYALAATLVHLITGQAPPNSQARLSALASNQPDLYEPLVGRCQAYDNDFLAAIDKAMNIVPAERLQSAEEWTLMIDHTKRVEIARAKAQNDKTIDQTVMNLVKSANAQSVPPGGTGCKPELSPQEPCVTAREAEMKSVPTITAKVTAEYTAEDLSHSDAANAPFVEEETTLAQSLPETPYLRVRPKAVEKARAADRRHGKLWRLRPRMSRLATVPVVFCAYFFYAQTVFQIEEIRSATLEPLRSLAMGRSGSAEETDTRDTNTGISVE